MQNEKQLSFHSAFCILHSALSSHSAFFRLLPFACCSRSAGHSRINALARFLQGGFVFRRRAISLKLTRLRDDNKGVQRVE